MKGASKVIMGATLVMVVSLAIVLGLVLVLLAELYCTLLLRRRQLRITSSNPSNTAPTTTLSSACPTANTSSPEPTQAQSHSASSRSYYAPGVLQAPRSLFFPAVSHKENKAAETKLSQLHHILDVHNQESNASRQQIGLVKTSPSSTSLVTYPRQIPEISIQVSSTTPGNKAFVGGSGDEGGGSFVYISNPIYDNDATRPSRVETPFETPDTSPSRLETGGSSSSGEEEITKPSPSSPHSLPLTPMKKLPAEACSVSLRDARSLDTSGSDSVSSSSGSPCTSPSW